jgi:hypothetical protein
MFAVAFMGVGTFWPFQISKQPVGKSQAFFSLRRYFDAGESATVLDYG